MEKVRIGILGGGGILGAHAPAFAALGDSCQVVAVAEPQAERRPRVHELLGPDVAIENDYRDLLARDDVDAVDILLPHFLHAPATIAAAEAGKPALVEKVMARNVYECDQMIAACDQAGVSLTVCHDRRYHGEWLALKEIVDSGALGELYSWKLEHNQNVVFPEGAWVRTRDGLGGGAIMSCLTHQIDALRWYDGEFANISCLTRVVPERMEGEAIGVIQAQMASGALAQLSINWMTRSNTGANALWYELIHVTGSAGEAYYVSGKGTYLWLYDDNAGPAWSWETEGETPEKGFAKVKCSDERGHLRCIREWVSHLRGEPADIRTSGREVRGTVEVAEAAGISAERGGAPVSLPITPTPWPEA